MSVDKYIECPDCDEIKIYLTYGTEYGIIRRIINALQRRKLRKDAAKRAVGTCPKCGLTITDEQINQLQ